jgi:hypothetical protein
MKIQKFRAIEPQQWKKQQLQQPESDEKVHVGTYQRHELQLTLQAPQPVPAL